eukprot:3322073-Lingulodinium_polyedra.AAC.1
MGRGRWPGQLAEGPGQLGRRGGPRARHGEAWLGRLGRAGWLPIGPRGWWLPGRARWRGVAPGGAAAGA